MKGDRRDRLNNKCSEGLCLDRIQYMDSPCIPSVRDCTKIYHFVYKRVVSPFHVRPDSVGIRQKKKSTYLHLFECSGAHPTTPLT
jgi:hypothetical protein